MKKHIKFETEDGKIFDNERDAIAHEKELNAIDHKKLCYELLQKNKKLSEEIEILKGFKGSIWNQNITNVEDSYQSRINKLKEMGPGSFIFFDSSNMKF